MAIELNIKWNDLIKGLPGVLNTLGTLLDRSQTIKHIFKNKHKMKGPMGPMGLGPKNHKFTKKHKNQNNSLLLENETDARRNSSKVWL